MLILHSSIKKNQVFSFSDWFKVIKGLQAAQAKGYGNIAKFNLTTVKQLVLLVLDHKLLFSILVVYGRHWQWEKETSANLLSQLAENSTNYGNNIQTGPYPDYNLTDFVTCTNNYQYLWDYL